MTEQDYQELDGVALAEMVEHGEASPLELMEHAVSLAATRGRDLNAICIERYEQAIDLARDWERTGAFRGIPFLLKDSSLASKRLPMNLGSRLFSNTESMIDATLTDRFERAGLIPFARTTMPELGMAPTAEAIIYAGPTLNPWDTQRSPGGSSGGAAAAVAARIVPIAHGSDGGGSIRIPASCCGVFGLKATRGRVPAGPSKGETWGGMGTDGVLSRTVRDTAVAMDAICGRELGAPYAAPNSPLSFCESIKPVSGEPLRIAIWTEAWDGIPIDKECLDAVEYAAALCRDLGHIVINGQPPAIDYGRFFRSHANVLASNIVASVHAKLESLKRALHDDDLEPVLLDGYRMGLRLSAESYIQSINCFHQVGYALQKDIAQYDVILCPTLTQLPASLDHFNMRGTFVDFRERVARYATFCAIMNASGQPAASIPIYWTKGGLPIGVQVMGQFGRDDLVLRLCAELEHADPWHDRLPQV